MKSNWMEEVLQKPLHVSILTGKIENQLFAIEYGKCHQSCSANSNDNFRTDVEPYGLIAVDFLH